MHPTGCYTPASRVVKHWGNGGGDSTRPDFIFQDGMKLPFCLDDRIFFFNLSSSWVSEFHKIQKTESGVSPASFSHLDIDIQNQRTHTSPAHTLSHSGNPNCCMCGTHSRRSWTELIVYHLSRLYSKLVSSGKACGSKKEEEKLVAG